MTTNPPTALESAARNGRVVNNQRVTAQILRDDDGDLHQVYQFAGRSYDSLTALADALEGSA